MNKKIHIILIVIIKKKIIKALNRRDRKYAKTNKLKKKVSAGY